MLPGIILAAGASSRMGRPKAGLVVGATGDTFLTASARALLDGGVASVTVVAGAHPAEVRAALDPTLELRVRVIDHAGWARGQLSSLVAGLDAVEAAFGPVDAVLVTLVDVPRVAPATVARLIACWAEQRAPVVRPRVGARHGHPVIFSREVFDALRQAPPEGGARSVVEALGSRIVDVDIDDAGGLLDIDTPADYRALGDSR